MIGGRAVLARFEGGVRTCPRRRSSLRGLPPRSRAPRSPVIRAPTGTGDGQAGDREPTERFPPRLGNLAPHARFPPSHRRSFVVSQDQDEEEDVVCQREPDPPQDAIVAPGPSSRFNRTRSGVGTVERRATRNRRWTCRRGGTTERCPPRARVRIAAVFDGCRRPVNHGLRWTASRLPHVV